MLLYIYIFIYSIYSCVLVRLRQGFVPAVIQEIPVRKIPYCGFQ